MHFTCFCGGKGLKSLTHFRRGRSCKACGHAVTGDKNGRLTLADAREAFTSLGHTLLVDTYVSNSTKMPYVCKCGTTHSMSLANMKKGRNCLTCAGKTAWSLESARTVYKDAGCELLATEYADSNVPMLYRCNCGDESVTTLGSFLKGVRCRGCGIKRITGANNYLYNSTKTDAEREGRRTYPGYQAWRKSVFARDAYTCQVCSAVGGTLNAHHLNDYATHKDQRTDLSNGVTLCRGCHKEFHDQYGRKNSTKEDQFVEFKGLKNHG